MTSVALVCGVDVGSLRTLSYVAWLRSGEFLLDLYVPSAENPLPAAPASLGAPHAIGVDAPQGLARPGSACRESDRAARTPTRALPPSRSSIEAWRPYGGLIEAGVSIFWSVHERGLASIPGLPADGSPTTAFETYPRYVIRRLWPELPIPSKRKAPLAYVEAVWGRIRERGYACRSVLRPCVDHVDAMLCALVAEALAESVDARLAGTVGVAPLVDEADRVLREGYIVSP